MSYYLITFNNLQGFDLTEIHGVITRITGISDWWHYLPNVYIVSSNNNAKHIADKLISAFQGLSFLVIKIDLDDYNGVLNKDAWEWIRKRKNQNLKLKPIPQTPQSSISPLSDWLLGKPLPQPPNQGTPNWFGDWIKSLEDKKK